MSIQVLMPALSPTMEEGALARWLIKEGDAVSPGDVIAEIETDKATMEVEAVDAGVVGRLMVPEGTAGVKVNTPIAVLLEEGETAAALDVAPSSRGAEPQEPREGQAAAAAPTVHAATAQAQTAAGRAGRIIASPLARRLAAAHGVDLAALSGSGPGGRIVKRDVERAAASVGPDRRESSAPAAPAAPAPSAAGPATAPARTDAVAKIYADRPHQVIALDGMRRTIAARLTEAKQTIPHFYLRRDIELDALLALRAQINAGLGPNGVKLSVNDFVIKACALGLARHPACNAVWAGDRILQFSAVDLAVAVAVEGGLYTPVIRDAASKSLSTLSAEMRDLAERARSRRLAPSEYQGGSFAISNLGMFGIDNFDAVINPPHAAILAVGAGVRRPVARGDELAVATVMSVTLSVDHRVIDGALGATFLSTVKDLIEQPLAMLV